MDVLLVVRASNSQCWRTSFGIIPDERHQYTKIITIISQPAYMFTKLTLLLLYYRLFSVDKIMRYLILAGMACCIIAYTALMFLFTFLAPTVHYLYVNDALGVFNLVSDIYIISLPVAVVSKLQLPTRRKLGIIMIFMTGILFGAASLNFNEYVLTLFQGRNHEHIGPHLPAQIQCHQFRHNLGLDARFLCHVSGQHISCPLT